MSFRRKLKRRRRPQKPKHAHPEYGAWPRELVVANGNSDLPNCPFCGEQMELVLHRDPEES